MKKLKSLILTICFMIVVSSSNIYATNRAIDYETTTSGTTSPATAGGKTELDGKIGEWDPNDLEKPNFDDYDDSSDIEGTIPNSGEYFTISMTVPLSMEFVVIPHNKDEFGLFYSPEYCIKNNGSKNVTVKVANIDQSKVVNDPDKTKLYIEEENHHDNKTQMELMLTALDTPQEKHVNLYDLTSLNEEQKTLCTLGANEVEKIKFDCDSWEIPKYASNKPEAETNFSLRFEFSVATPSTVTTP